jgi:putative flippase GtrA
VSAAVAETLRDRGGNRLPRLPANLRKLGGESIRYFVVSAVALGCDLAVYAGLIKGGAMAAAAGALGYALGMLVHYALSTYWVFPDVDGTRRTAPTLVKFAATGLLGLMTTAAIIDVLTRHHIAGAYAAKGAAVVSAFLAVFILRRMYVFAGSLRT